MQDRSDEGQVRYRTDQIQVRTDAGQDDGGQGGCRTGRMQYRKDAEQEDA